mgnify:CR=1 FL=1
MFDAIIGTLGRFAFGSKLLAVLNAANAAVAGKRTEIIAALQVLIYILNKLGVIPPGAQAAVDAAALALLGALPVTLAEKISRAQKLADKVVPSQPPA